MKKAKLVAKDPNISTAKTIVFSDPAAEAQCECEFCNRKKRFSAPMELVDLFIKGDVVLFAGAGVSSEAKGLLPDTFYEKISYEIGHNELTRPFPDVMEEYCTGPKGKVGLVQELKEHLDYIYAHRSIYEQATRFHRQLATFFPIDTIVTTNWDTYFEDECGATPFVQDEDIALWNAAPRKVLKIHGTIANLGSIVATRSDYDRCTRRLRNNVVGSHLKSLLATRSTVFIGYSLRDDDFLQIYHATRRHLADFHRQAYFIAPNLDPADQERLKKLDLVLIDTDGEFFLEQIKKHAYSRRCFCPDEMYDNVTTLLMKVSLAHDRLHKNFNIFKHPQVLFSSWYQDGMQHALDRILRLKRTGIYSDRHRVIEGARSYFYFSDRFRSDKKYGDAAYCQGYANAHVYASLSEAEQRRVKPPLFFYFGFETSDEKIFKRKLPALPDLHKTAFNYAKRITSKYDKDSTIVIHHPDQLYGLGKYLTD